MIKNKTKNSTRYKFFTDTRAPSRVWMVGSSIVKNAFIAARSRPGGISLGLSTYNISLWWQGYGGLQLSQLRRKIKWISLFESSPDFIVLHCGGNDLGTLSLTELRWVIRTAVAYLVTNFPMARLIWSQILPRLSWRHSENHKAMDRARIRLNSYAAKQIINMGGAYIRHPDIQMQVPALFRNDGVHLSDVGNCVFLNTIQGGLEKIIWEGETVYPR